MIQMGKDTSDMKVSHDNPDTPRFAPTSPQKNWWEQWPWAIAVTVLIGVLSFSWNLSANIATIKADTGNTTNTIADMKQKTKENNDKLETSIKEITSKLHGLDKQLFIIEGKISNLADKKTQSQQTNHPINY